MTEVEAGIATGLVLAAHGRHAMVRVEDGRVVRCVPRAKRLEAVVGDRVRWQPAGDEGVIESVLPRRNLMFRQDEWRTKAFAANLDQLLVLVAVAPPFSESILARALIAARAEGIAVLGVLNKADLPEADAAWDRLQAYRALGIEWLRLSLKQQGEQAQALLSPRLAGRRTLVLGPSGMGKSTLINRMVPGALAAVGEVSKALNAGRHTTTTTSWFDLDGGGALIDSPGFQTFGLNHVDANRLASLMPDLAEHAGGCRFANCSHRHEPGCAVRSAAQRGEVAPARLRVYESLYEELDRRRW